MQDKLSDEVLMFKYQRGDVQAFETLLDRHRKPVFNFIHRFLGNYEQSEDVFQEVFLKIVINAKSYRRTAKFTTWLYRIARNACIDASRAMVRKRTVSLSSPISQNTTRSGGPEMSVEDRLKDDSPGADTNLMRAEVRECLDRLVALLSEEQREVFLLRESLNLPFKEIARITGCSQSTVKSRMRYALENLRRKIERDNVIKEVLG